MNLVKSFFFLFIAFTTYLSGSSETSDYPYLSETSDYSIDYVSDEVQIDTIQLKMASNGHAVAVWQYEIGHKKNSVIQANVFNGNWMGLKTLSAHHEAIDPKLAVTAHQNDIIAVAVWIQKEKEVRSLFAAMLISSTKEWTNAAQISTKDENVIGSHFHVKLSETGNAIVIWSSVDKSGNHYVRASTSHVDYKNAWSFPTYVSGP